MFQFQAWLDLGAQTVRVLCFFISWFRFPWNASFRLKQDFSTCLERWLLAAGDLCPGREPSAGWTILGEAVLALHVPVVFCLLTFICPRIVVGSQRTVEALELLW